MTLQMAQLVRNSTAVRQACETCLLLHMCVWEPAMHADDNDSSHALPLIFSGRSHNWQHRLFMIDVCAGIDGFCGRRDTAVSGSASGVMTDGVERSPSHIRGTRRPHIRSCGGFVRLSFPVIFVIVVGQFHIRLFRMTAWRPSKRMIERRKHEIRSGGRDHRRRGGQER